MNFNSILKTLLDQFLYNIFVYCKFVSKCRQSYKWFTDMLNAFHFSISYCYCSKISSYYYYTLLYKKLIDITDL